MVIARIRRLQVAVRLRLSDHGVGGNLSEHHVDLLWRQSVQFSQSVSEEHTAVLPEELGGQQEREAPRARRRQDQSRQVRVSQQSHPTALGLKIGTAWVEPGFEKAYPHVRPMPPSA